MALSDSWHKILIDCDCSKHVVRFWFMMDEHRFENDQFGYVSLGTYSSQDNIIPKIRERLKMIWAILRGREWQFSEIILNQKDSLRLRDFMNELKLDEGADGEQQ